MKQASLTDGQQCLLTRFSEAGGVVDFLICECESGTANQRLHHDAVLFALRDIQRREDHYAEHALKEMGIPKSRIFPVNINDESASKITPRRITWKEFLGNRYDSERRGLFVLGKGDFSNQFFFYRDRAIQEHMIPPDGIDYGIGSGFPYAFSSPPYPIQLSAEDLGEMFDKFLHFIIGGSDDSLIYEWPTDWSNYFDAGKEWWGSFLWSISNPGSSRIVVIAASTTD